MASCVVSRSSRPYRAYVIEFLSGDRVTVRHPEAVVRRENLYLLRNPDGAFRIFSAAAVCQLMMPAP